MISASGGRPLPGALPLTRDWPRWGIPSPRSLDWAPKVGKRSTPLDNHIGL